MTFIGFNIAPANGLWISELPHSAREVSIKAEKDSGCQAASGLGAGPSAGPGWAGMLYQGIMVPCRSETVRGRGPFTWDSSVLSSSGL